MAVVLVLANNLLDSKTYQEAVSHKTLKVPFRLLFIGSPLISPLLFVVRFAIYLSSFSFPS
jgi:hypothetical protein